MFLGAGRVARGLSRMGHAGFLRCRSTPLRSAAHALASRPWHWHHLTPAKDHDFRSQWPFHPFCGHHHGAARLTKTNDFGNAVEEMGGDYQMAYQGGNGQMRLKGFDLTHNTIDVLSFSPWGVYKPRSMPAPVRCRPAGRERSSCGPLGPRGHRRQPREGRDDDVWGGRPPCFATARTRRASHRHGRGHHAVEGGAGSWSWRRADGCFGQIVEIRLAAEPLPSAP